MVRDPVDRPMRGEPEWLGGLCAGADLPFSAATLGPEPETVYPPGRKRRLPPRGTDKDLINQSGSHPSWLGARALHSQIARGGD